MKPEVLPHESVTHSASAFHSTVSGKATGGLRTPSSSSYSISAPMTKARNFLPVAFTLSQNNHDIESATV